MSDINKNLGMADWPTDRWSQNNLNLNQGMSFSLLHFRDHLLEWHTDSL
jgi:hypothetical protein